MGGSVSEGELMKIKIGSRQSDLAKLQAHLVSQALMEKHPAVEVEHYYFSSLGDQNSEDPLWKMPEKGVFTQDLTQKLEQGELDLVVHSYKDLPIEENQSTLVLSGTSRADARDLLLVRKDRMDEIQKSKKLRVFSSSPRRREQLGRFLPEAFPLEINEVLCEVVRGNIGTRLNKYLTQDIDAYVIAKAAVDRVLQTKDPEFSKTREIIKNALSRSQFMILPLMECPTAPAQGALAIEIQRGRGDLHKLVQLLHDPIEEEALQLERETLKKYGGGCHQSFGATCLVKSYGRIFVAKGRKENGEALSELRFERKKTAQIMDKVSEDRVWPLQMADSPLYERKNRAVNLDQEVLKKSDFWVAREVAWPQGLKPKDSQLVWASGLRTWRKLAAQGIWVNGSSEGFGENEATGLKALVDRPLSFIKLSHSEAPESLERPLFPTYDLIEKNIFPDLQGRTHFFWASYSSFKRAYEKYPEIKEAHHFTGPGNTYTLVRKALGPEAKIEIYPSYYLWRDELLQNE